MIRKGSKVKWLSRYAEASGKVHWFKGRVVAVYGVAPNQVCVVDDGSGMTLRCVPWYKLMETL